MGLMCAIRAKASLQPGLGERPRRSGRRGRRRRATATFHPPEPRPPSRCQRRHRGDLRGQHSQLHGVTRVPQRAAARQHGAGPDEAGDQQVSSVISALVSFFRFIPMKSIFIVRPQAASPADGEGEGVPDHPATSAEGAGAGDYIAEDEI